MSLLESESLMLERPANELSLPGELSRDLSLHGKGTRVKLSIVIPCYNEEKTLEKCVERVLAIQDETLELELIVIDDCSTDNTQEAARRLMESMPGLVLLRHEVN